MTALAMLVALAVDGAVGWPEAVFRRIGHPVTWIGALIDLLDRRWNRAEDDAARRRANGVGAVLATLAATLLPTLVLAALMPGGLVGAVVTGLLSAPLVATRSLHAHVAAVARPLAAGDLAAARRAVALIVGRDPERLDEPGVARAALESLAENTSDGVVAPVFWGVVAGLPGIAAYKAINTLDSMIGHRTPRHEDFGRFAAQLDDLVNWLPARLTGGLFALAGGRPAPAWSVMRRDAPHHRSPNAGWPEAALAAALGVRLSGPRSYGGGQTQDPWLNAAARDPGAADIRAGLHLLLRMLLLGVPLLLLVATLQ